jgi:hypothetical protein
MYTLLYLCEETFPLAFSPTVECEGKVVSKGWIRDVKGQTITRQAVLRIDRTRTITELRNLRATDRNPSWSERRPLESLSLVVARELRITSPDGCPDRESASCKEGL